MNYASYQTMPAPDVGSDLTPTNIRQNPIIHQPGVQSIQADGSSSTQRPNSVSASDLQPHRPGILNNARTTSGAPVMGDLKPTDIVTVSGMEMSVAIAEQLGMLSKDASGRYAEIEGGVDAAKAAPQQDAPVDDAEAFSDRAAEDAFSAVVQTVSPTLQVSALQEVLNGGEVNASTLSRAASEAGVEPSALGSQVDAIKASFRAQAVSAVQSYGSNDAEGFFEWAHENKPRAMKEAMQAHGMERSTKGYEPLYREYVASMAEHDPESVLQAKFGDGITARREGNLVILNIPDRGQMSYRAALSAGLIKVAGA